MSDQKPTTLEEALERIAELEATLDGDPHQTATPEQRRAWRASAVRYADKVERELADCRKRLTTIRARWAKLYHALIDVMPGDFTRRLVEFNKLLNPDPEAEEDQTKSV